jgi:hypothetical protein
MLIIRPVGFSFEKLSMHLSGRPKQVTSWDTELSKKRDPSFDERAEFEARERVLMVSKFEFEESNERMRELSPTTYGINAGCNISVEARVETSGQ